MATTPLQAWPVPSLSDVPNGPAQLLALGTAAEQQAVMSFTTSTARDAAIISPVAGMVAYLSTPKQLTAHDGTGWYIVTEPNQTFTPAWTNVTIGNGVNGGTYHRSDGWLDFTVTLTLGSTSAVTGQPTLTLPIASAGFAFGTFNVIFNQVGTALFAGTAAGGTTTTALYAVSASGTYAQPTPASATVPFTFANTHQIIVSGRNRMTTRYS